MSRLHTNPGQPSRHLYHALRSAVGQRTIRIRPFPFIPLHRNTMPQQHAIHHPSFLFVSLLYTATRPYTAGRSADHSTVPPPPRTDHKTIVSALRNAHHEASPWNR